MTAERRRRGPQTGTLYWLPLILNEDRLDPSETLLLIGLADHVNDRDECFVGLERLARLGRCSYSTAKRRMAALAEMGAIGRVRRRHKGNLSVYDYHLCREWFGEPSLEVNLAPSNGSPERSLARAHPDEPAEVPRTEQPRKDLGAEQARTQKRARDPLWDALIEACGFTHVTPTPPERGAWNKALKDIRAVGGTPELIHERARAYRKTWPNVRLTPSALARHWGSLGADEPNDDAGVLSAYGLTRG